MTITKTDFINYTRCSRYIALEEIKKDKWDADVVYASYKDQEKAEMLEEMFYSMFEENDDGELIDKTAVVNKQLEAMMPYYKKVEEEAGRIAQECFGGTVTYAEKTKDQVSFDFSRDGVRFLCYVDIYNEQSDGTINIIEVKATTSKKYRELVCSHKKSEKFPIFYKENNIYKLKGEIDGYPIDSEMPLEDYEKKRSKLLNRFDIGSYIYDLAVQRFIIEGEYKSSNEIEKLSNIHYYLAVLNDEYIFDGTYEDNKPIYHKDENDEELITFFQMDDVTKELQKSIEDSANILIHRLYHPDAKECPLGVQCGYKKQTCCKYFQSVCGSKIPPKNSSLNYIQNPFGFVKEDGTRIKGLELINEGYLDMLDVPEEWITRNNHRIQRECLKTHEEFIQKDKIKAGIDSLKYPIYHLDFETFPCPVPRFKGEWPYIQSPFEFSLHIENEPRVCDKLKDNVIFLNKTTGDEREEMIRTMLKYMDPNKGTLLAQNVPFEKGRIKELAKIFPEYREPLMKLYERGFDLLWLVNNNKYLYKDLGFEGESLDTFNYYNYKLSGSFSIKKTLPVFSDLSYANLVVKNGTEAIVEYANYPNMSKEEFALKYRALEIYCQQDTWAMVEILNALREKVR